MVGIIYCGSTEQRLMKSDATRLQLTLDFTETHRVSRFDQSQE